MPRTPPAYVTPSTLRWARESIGYDLEEAAARLGLAPARLEEAERGDTHLTLRQAEEAARIYERPLAALFLPEPPEEEPPEAQFRRLPGAPPPPWPRQMRALARRVRSRQDAAAELYELLEEEPPWLAAEVDYDDNPAALAARARDLLDVGLAEQRSWRDTGGYRPLRAWVDAVEALGVLVMQDGSLPVEEMRGFASTHPAVPAIVVNTNDDPRARAFTVVHELGHLLRVRAGRPAGTQLEAWCDDFAGELLAPRRPFAADFARHAVGNSLLGTVDALALDYGITPFAVAVRVSRLELAERGEMNDVLEQIRERWRGREPSAGGGDYYRTTIGRLGPSFVELVFAALDRQAVTYPAAAAVLGVKVGNFGRLREHAAERGR